MRAEYKDSQGETWNFDVETFVRADEHGGLSGPPVYTTHGETALKLMGVSEGRAYYQIDIYRHTKPS